MTKLVTIQECSVILGMSTRTVRRRVKNGTLKAVKQGNKVFVELDTDTDKGDNSVIAVSDKGDKCDKTFTVNDSIADNDKLAMKLTEMVNGKDKTVLEIYKSTMDELFERRRIEWQTFAIINVVYLALIKALYDIISLSVFEAGLITIVVSAFSWIWLIRIYGNGMRFLVLRNVRNKIVDDWGHSSMFQDARSKAKCGWKCWRMGEDRDDWPFFGHRGICYAIYLYCLVVLSMLWVRAVDVDIRFAFKIGIVILAFILVIVVPLMVDRVQVKRSKT